MAIQISYNSQYGFTSQESYVRIDRFMGNKESIRVDCQYFYNKDARNNQQQPIGYHSFDLQITDGATMKDMYSALKDLPEFEGAIDI